MYTYVYTSILVVVVVVVVVVALVLVLVLVVVHLWGRLSAVQVVGYSPVKSLHIDISNTQYRQYSDMCRLPIYCRIICGWQMPRHYQQAVEGDHCTVFHIARHSPTQGHLLNAQPNDGPAGRWQALTR